MFQRAACPRLHATREIVPEGRWAEKLALLLRCLKDGGTFALCGAGNRGKTQMAVEVLRSACAMGIASRYATAQGLCASRRDAIGNHAEGPWMNVMGNLGALVIDEISDCDWTPAEQRYLRELLDVRYAWMGFTVLVTNHDPEALAALLGEKVNRRIAERGGVIVADWEPIGPVAGGGA